MENDTILSIDATSPTLRAVLAAGSGSEIEVKEAFSIDASEWWNSHFCTPASSTTPANEEGESGATENGNSGANGYSSSPFPIEEILARFPSQSWEESLIVLPAHQALTLHLELPFSQKASLSRIAPLEAQDRLPFSVDSFHCYARPVRKISPNLFDIQVDLYPDKLLSNLIGSCKEAKFEPSVVTIPPGLGELCHSLYPKYISANSFLIFRSGLDYSVTALIEGKPVGYFSIPLEGDSVHNFPGEGSLNVWIAAIEERFSTEVERVYFVGAEGDFSVWDQSEIIRQSEHLNFEDLLPNCQDKEAGLSTLAATALSGEKQEIPSPNYRTGRYLFRPELRNLFEGTRTLLMPFLFVLLAFAIVIPVRYAVREHRIASLEQELVEAVNQKFPEAEIPEGQELAAVQAKLQQARTILQQLGTGSSIAPHEELVLLLQKLRKYEGLTLNKINIRQDLTVVSGTAASYGDAEAIETQFKALTDPYCEAKLDTQRGRVKVGQQGFNLSLRKDCS